MHLKWRMFHVPISINFHACAHRLKATFSNAMCWKIKLILWKFFKRSSITWYLVYSGTRSTSLVLLFEYRSRFYSYTKKNHGVKTLTKEEDNNDHYYVFIAKKHWIFILFCKGCNIFVNSIFKPEKLYLTWTLFS